MRTPSDDFPPGSDLPPGSRAQSSSSSAGTHNSIDVSEAGAEPAVKRAPVPALLVALLTSLLYWGGMYVLEFGGQADARVHYPYTSYKQLQDLQPKGEEEIIAAKGFLVYGRICSSCHQPDGNGSASQNAPPLGGSEWVLPKDPSRIIRIVLHGLSGPITVKGKEYGAGQMLAWKDALTDEDIANVLSYVRNSWGNKAPVVKADEVKKIRAETKDRPSYMTVEDLMKVLLKD